MYIAGSSFQLMITLGILFVYCIGAVTTWKILAFVSAIPAVILFVVMFFSYETPNYLIQKGKETEARKALQHFRGKLYVLFIKFVLELIN